jgi:hypothetical protein
MEVFAYPGQVEQGASVFVAAAPQGDSLDLPIGHEIIQSATLDSEPPLDIPPPTKLRQNTHGAAGGDRSSREARCRGWPDDLSHDFFGFRVANQCAMAFVRRSCREPKGGTRTLHECVGVTAPGVLSVGREGLAHNGPADLHPAGRPC